MAQHEVAHQLAAQAGQHGGADHGILNLRMLHQRDFDFAGLNAETVHFELLVCTPQVGQYPLRVTANQIAGAVPAACQARHGSQKALLREAGLSQVAVGQGFAAQQQFTFSLFRYGASFRVTQGNLNVGQRRADGRDGGPLGRIDRQLEGGDHMAFGRAVVVVQDRTVEPLEELPNRGGDLQLLARADDVLQNQLTRLFPVCFSQHLQCHIGQIQACHLVVNQSLVQQIRVAAVCFGDQHHRALASHGGENFLKVHVERQRCEQQGCAPLAQARVARVPVDQVPQGGLPHGHPLGGAGRA